MPFKNPHPLYSVWQGIKRRCLNPNSRQWADYGGRGITICDRWKSSFDVFVEDMGPRPEGFLIDRIDNDGSYAPENCRWVSHKESQRNQRRTHYIIIDGAKVRAIEVAEMLGLKTDTIISRAAKGLAVNELLSPKKLVFREGLALGGRANGARIKQKTHCPHGHSYADALISRQGWRKCRACHCEKARKQRAKKSATRSV